jgi:hypothetical protein
MTAATERRIISKQGEDALPERIKGDVAADETFKQGWLLMRNSDGYVVEATAASGYTSAGIAWQDCDATDFNDGDLTVDCLQGVFDLVGKTGGGDDLHIGDIGTVVYAVDNQTVGKVSTSRSPAGILMGVNEENGCMRVLVGAAAAAVSTQLTTGVRIQAGQGALTTGVLTVSTGITTTSSSQVFVQLVTPGGTLGTSGYKAAVTVVGAPSTGTIVITSINDNAGTDTSDTSTVAWLIVG